MHVELSKALVEARSRRRKASRRPEEGDQRHARSCRVCTWNMCVTGRIEAENLTYNMQVWKSAKHSSEIRQP
eukprot:4890760-Pleurochrysis_carterae.AAC.1